MDPGRKACGLAVFRGKTLIACGYARADLGEGPVQWFAMADSVVDKLYTLVPNAARGGLHIDTLAIEKMQTRPGRNDAHESLIELSQVAGCLWGLLPWVRGYAVPPSWTGGRPKTKNHPRIRAALSGVETTVLERGLYGVPSIHVKEVVDAIGIGLYVNQRIV